MSLEHVQWELSVLSRAIHYKNLSSAAAHVAISQPQLSRIISKLEAELNLVLLDRTARRKSGWTPVAFKLADVYLQSSRRLQHSVMELQSADQVNQLSIGMLEGLVPTTLQIIQYLAKNLHLHLIEANVFDLSDLEEHFLREDLDLIITCREPGLRKYKNLHFLGTQALEWTDNGPIKLYSPFEYSKHKPKKQGPKEGLTILSNSLALRKSCIETIGGSGILPSEVRRRKGPVQGEEPVFILASDILNPELWKTIKKFEIRGEK